MQLRSLEPPGYLVIDTVNCQMQCMLLSEEYDTGHMCWNMMNCVLYMYIRNTNYIMCATLLVMYAVRDLYPEAKSIIFTPDMFVSLSRISTVLHSLYTYIH